ncbi:MAG TPA: SRPBCC domain-containing protein [Fimbriimonadaceae bacterium]|nr:SRPBCC domain-containing protein [Fimbriimonadaceae bacterium]
MSATADKNKITFPSDTEVLVERSFAAPKQLLWEVITQCEHMRVWMHGFDGWTLPICEMDLRAGGSIRWGWLKGDDGTSMEIKGEFLEVTPPDRMKYRESWGEPWPDSMNIFELEEVEGGTKLNLTMQFPSKAARDSAVETGMNDGLSVSYGRLDDLLSSLQ